MDIEDRELLELAAKAYQADNPAWHQAPYDSFRRGFMSNWNPSDDDGDALRLANHLGLTIGRTYEGAYVDLCSGEILQMTGSCQHECLWSEFGGDKNAACRYAILLCAAQIGRAMP